MKKTTEPEREIILRGVRVNNLKNVDVSFPTGKLIVVTGLSGSGKSSLVFDTLYAEGQRRYVESLSSYARQFLGRMSKPEVDFVDGISPAIAIEQKTLNANPRSTVGTVTEIYEYLKLLFARIGKIYSPVSGVEVRRHSVANVADFAATLPEETKLYILSPVCIRQGLSTGEYLQLLEKMGFSRLYKADARNSARSKIVNISECTPATDLKRHYLLVDRLVVRPEEAPGALYSRIFDSVQTAFNEGEGRCFLECTAKDGKSRLLEFSNRLEADGMSFVKPSPNFFSFNNPYGACKRCGGIGTIDGVSEDLVVPDPSLSIYEDAVACWRGEKMSEWKKEFIRHAEDFPIHRPYKELSEAEKHLLWYGNRQVKGIYDCFKFIEKNSYKIQYRVMASRYRGITPCPECHGSRLRPDAAYVKIDGKSITDLVRMQVGDLAAFFKDIHLSAHERAVAARTLTEIENRLSYLQNVGLSYLTLDRRSSTLSGGEGQRIHLANSIGSALVGSLYILDEPSIGLHSRDTDHLIQVIRQLRDLGNTVIVVEHDEAMMLAADYIIDVGPQAGRFGGEIVFAGTPSEMLEKGDSLTARYLRGEMCIPVPESRRAWTRSLRLCGASCNNLKDVSVSIPLNVMTVVTGVSGSGKTSLIRQTLYPALQRALGSYPGGDQLRYKRLEGDFKCLKAVELVDQNPIGRSSRSNPATYLKAFDDIRELFAAQPLARQRLFAPGYFSFNVQGGRCEACQGEGTIKVEMQFMADLFLECDQCHGKRFKDEVLEIKYRDKNIADVLEMSIDEALEFFSADPDNACVKRLCAKLQVLQDVGLGYLHLGQSSSSLSGGEAQRVKLAYFLCRGKAEEKGHTLFIFDEPTTGLHFHDIRKLQIAFDALIERGHTVLVIEHQLDVVKLADWVIEVGPEGGAEGGNIVFEGTPEELVNVKESHTGHFLKEKLALPSAGLKKGGTKAKAGAKKNAKKKQ
ncbi:MAG: excinuclease ABC subunit UvrA [Bacteroides sp.]|nr:excinuclease ABC subunit UvrA [Bacteroides sp.]MCM1085768.1 excinuclease ABC subunit UvrA [Bacteroides sp.]